MKLRYCCNLTTTPDFSEITNLEELSLEGCVNLVSVHPSIGMLKRLVVLNLKECTRVRSFPGKLEMDSLQVLNLSGCLKVDQLPEALGQIKTLTKLHIDRTAINEIPSFVSSLINLESLSFGGQERIQSRWWTSFTSPFGLLSKQQHPQIPRSVMSSLAGLRILKDLNLSYCNLVQVPESIGGLSCLKELNLEGNNLLEMPESIGGLSFLEELYLNGNNFTCLPGSLSQPSNLKILELYGCKKLEVLPELSPSLRVVSACDCTSLGEVSGSSNGQFRNSRINDFRNCPKLFSNHVIDSQVLISETQCLDSSITSRFSSFLGYAGIQNNIFEFFRLPGSSIQNMNIIYHGNSIPDWFTNKSIGNHVKVELPSDWSHSKFRGFGTCVVFKRKKPYRSDMVGYSVKHFDEGSIPCYHGTSLMEPTKINESYMIWLRYMRITLGWEEAKNFVTFCFEDEDEDVEDIEVKEIGVRLVCDGDIEQDTNLSMLPDDLPTLSQHGGALSYSGPFGNIDWSW